MRGLAQVVSGEPQGTANRSVALDLIRGLAALSVLLLHARFFSFAGFSSIEPDYRTIIAYVVYGTSRFGADGVLIFFVLSGFLVGGAILRSLENKTFSDTKYWLERVSRIIPPLVAATIITCLTSFYLNKSVNIAQAIGNTMGLNGLLVKTLSLNGPLWSLAYEIWFYIFGWAIATFILYRRTLFRAALSLGGIFVFSILNWHYLLFWWTGALFGYCRFEKVSGRLFVLGAPLMATGIALHQLLLHNNFFLNKYLFSSSELLIVLGFSATMPFMRDDTNSSLNFFAPLVD